MFDLEVAQKYLSENNLNGWLLYDFQGINSLAHKVLGIKPNATRRYYLFISPNSEPKLILSSIDKMQFSFCNFQKLYFSTLNDMTNILRELLSKCQNILMDYSQNCNIPQMSKVDFGTVEYIKSLCNCNIYSSADLFQLAVAKWKDISLNKNLEAANLVSKIKDEAFLYIFESIKSNSTVSEYQVQQFIMSKFKENNLLTEDVPIVAINKNSSDPHYEPSAMIHDNIKRGDWILIDLWAKFQDVDAVFSDITWVGFCGEYEEIPSEFIEIFEIVKKARDNTVNFLEQNWKNQPEGWEIDKIARDTIASSGYGKYFIHRTGHSIAPGDILHAMSVNLDGYEMLDTRKILPGLGFSIEPGIYLEKFGVRLEINVYIHPENGPIVTTPVQDQIITFATYDK